jgi:hypothetical protein
MANAEVDKEMRASDRANRKIILGFKALKISL